ncbi:MAG: aconitate hydratase [Candidatus Bathyarchaeia archaeon]
MTAKTLAEKVVESHLVDGRIEPGAEIGLRVDRVLMQDATGTMACLQFEAMGLPRVRCEHAVVYVDHNLLQAGYENADDHRFLQSFSAKYGIHFSKPGNGICHQVNLERFSVPGKTLLGSDSHTPTAGGAGMLGIGAGGLDVAAAMGGAAFYFEMPRILGVHLKGELKPWVTAKDVILELLRRLTVKGGVGKILEYHGEGVKTLSVPERATIANMGAELGATSSIFPSDEVTRDYLRRQGRAEYWRPLAADPGAEYDEELELDLGSLEPLIACPGSPDNVRKVSEVEAEDVEVQQVLIGSCTNSSFKDLMTVALVLKDRKVHPDVSLHVNPGSRQVLQTLIEHGGLKLLVSAGARIMENACDGCVGLGSAPASNSNSVRSFNRNWPGRSGTPDDRIYLASPEVCVAAALHGRITDPRRLGEYPRVAWPRRFVLDDSMVLPPSERPENIQVVRGPNIKPLPRRGPLESTLEGEVLIKLGDNISTDAILPAGAKVLPLRSNIPAISEHLFEPVDPGFARRAKEKGGGFIVAGSNYGQGSSREHAALAPMYLGVKAVMARSFARIHKANLVNFGILPLEFNHPDDYLNIRLGNRIRVENILEALRDGAEIIPVQIDETTLLFRLTLPQRARKVLAAGGLLNYTAAGGA